MRLYCAYLHLGKHVLIQFLKITVLVILTETCYDVQFAHVLKHDKIVIPEEQRHRASLIFDLM